MKPASKLPDRSSFSSLRLPVAVALGWLEGWRGDFMRAVTFQSPVVSQPPDAVDQLLSSDRLVTAKEVARLLSISEKTVYSYVSKGLMPYYKIQSSVRFRAKDLSLWLSRHRYAAR